MIIYVGEFTFTIEEFVGLLTFGLAFLIQLFYLILLMKFIFSSKQKGKESDFPSVSLVVTSRNYREQLEELLPVLLSQDYPDYEVVVVDDCSTDGTDWLLAELKISCNHLKTTRIIQETDFPNALALTIGVRAATKSWLVFLSPLCKVGSDQWLKDYAHYLQSDKDVSIGYMNYNQAKGNFKSWIRFEHFTSFLLSGAGRYCGVATPVFEYNMAYTRDKFFELRGFAAVLDSPFSENELFLNKISRRKNSVVQLSKTTPISFTGEADWIDYAQFKKKQFLLRQKFTWGQRIFLIINQISRLILAASLILLLILSPLKFWILGAWSFLLLMEIILTAIASNKTGERNFLPMLLIYKAFLPLINIYFFINQIFSGQKRKWK